jgi:hypothetical protein
MLDPTKHSNAEWKQMAAKGEQDVWEQHGNDFMNFVSVITEECKFILEKPIMDRSFATVPGPAHYNQFLKEASDEQQRWMEAIDKERNAVVGKGVFAEECIEAELDKTKVVIIPTRYVLAKKIDDKGVAVYKARLVAQHIKTRFWDAFSDTTVETYAPVMHSATFRLIFILAVLYNLKTYQFDVNTAFLNADYERTNVYVRPPHGFTPTPGKVYRLQKPLYGLQDAPKAWYDFFKKYLLKAGFTMLNGLDECLFYRFTEDGSIILLAFHVDDNLAAYPESQEGWWKAFVAATAKEFGIKDLGVPTWCLGVNIAVDAQNNTISLTQRTYIEKVLEKFNLENEYAVTSPELAKNTELRGLKATLSPDAVKADTDNMAEHGYTMHLYQQYCGSILFPTLTARPDISHAAQWLARDLNTENLTTAHFEAAIRVFKYMKGTMDFGLRYSDPQRSEFGGKHIKLSDRKLLVEAYCDASFANDYANCKSTTGYAIYINGNLLIWASKQQKSVVPSTNAAEYIAMADAVRHLIWLTDVLSALGFQVQMPMPVYGDNQSQVHVAQSPAYDRRLRGVRVAQAIVRTEHMDKFINVQWIPGRDNVADIFTKPLPAANFMPLRNKLVYHSAASTND